MPKFKTMIDGKETEVDLTEDQIAESIGKDSGVIQKLRKLLKIDEEPKKEIKAEETKVKTETKSESKVSEQTGTLELIKAELAQVKAEREAEKTAQAERSTRIRENKVRKILDNAVAEGKIAKGQTDKLVKEYKDVHSKYLENYLSAIKADPAIKKQNSSEATTTEGKPAGAKIYKASEVKNMNDEDYSKVEKDVWKAIAEGNYIDS